jgi:hypothetical protein
MFYASASKNVKSSSTIKKPLQKTKNNIRKKKKVSTSHLLMNQGRKIKSHWRPRNYRFGSLLTERGQVETREEDIESGLEQLEQMRRVIETQSPTGSTLFILDYKFDLIINVVMGHEG